MRHLAGIGLLLLALGACQSLPAIVRIEVDGSTLEFKKKVPEASAPTETETGANAVADAPAG